MMRRTIQKKRLKMSCAKLSKTPIIKSISAEHVLKSDRPKQYCGNNIGHTLYTVYINIKTFLKITFFEIISVRKSWSL